MSLIVHPNAVLLNSTTLRFLYTKETSIKLSLMLLEVLQILGSCLTFQSHRNLWDSRSRSHVYVRRTIWRQEGSETGRKKEMSGRLLHVWCERSEALLCCLILFSFFISLSGGDVVSQTQTDFQMWPHTHMHTHTKVSLTCRFFQLPLLVGEICSFASSQAELRLSVLGVKLGGRLRHLKVFC